MVERSKDKAPRTVEALEAEIVRLNKVVRALIHRAEQATTGQGSSFNLFQSTILLEVQVRARTRELEAALRENERMTRDLARAQARMKAEIAERRRAEDRLRQAAAVFSNTQDGVIIADPEGRVAAVNQAFTNITEYTDSEVVGQHLSRLQSGRAGPAVWDHIWGIVRESGSWQGEAWNRRKSGDAYLEWLTINAVTNGADKVQNYIAVFSDITRVRFAHEMEHLAHHDSLTGLPNRLLLLSRVERAIERARRHGGRGAILFFDLDRFKHVNDSLGHAAGDELLCAVAGRLHEHLRRIDTLARLGGDEFVVVVEDLADPEQAASIAQGLVDQLRRPFHIAGGHEIYIGASVGIALFPDDGEDPGQLIQRADTALYQAKERGRGAYRFYTAAMTHAAEARVRMEAAMRRALERGEFQLHYQPLVRVADNRVTGVEALVRWRPPAKHAIAPTEFIPLAEETGLILPLGEWILREACRFMERLRAAGVMLDTIAVNLSPRQFNHPALHQRVSAILAETGLPPSCLELEITEGAIMEHGTEVDARLAALKDLGVRLAIDDFGTGYSSLAYLKRLPIDKLKVDRSFVHDIPANPADMQIVAAVIALGKNLKLEVLAEGVETAAQHGFMARHQCDACQGFYFSQPLPGDELMRWLTTHGAAGGARHA